jgi:hypothetical protein
MVLKLWMMEVSPGNRVNIGRKGMGLFTHMCGGATLFANGY